MCGINPCFSVYYDDQEEKCSSWLYVFNWACWGWRWASLSDWSAWWITIYFWNDPLLFLPYVAFSNPPFTCAFKHSWTRLKKWWVMPLLFLAYETIIMLNTALLTFTGLATREGFTPLQLFIDRQYLNNSFVFGPTPDMGIVGETIGNMTFPFMKTDIFNLTNGDEFYWPVIWLLIPSYIIFVPLYTVLALPFRKKHEVMSLEFV